MSQNAEWRLQVVNKMNDVQTNLRAAYKLAEICSNGMTLTVLDLSQLHALAQQSADEVAVLLGLQDKVG